MVRLIPKDFRYARQHGSDQSRRHDSEPRATDEYPRLSGRVRVANHLIGRCALACQKNFRAQFPPNLRRKSLPHLDGTRIRHTR